MEAQDIEKGKRALVKIWHPFSLNALFVKRLKSNNKRQQMNKSNKMYWIFDFLFISFFSFAVSLVFRSLTWKKVYIYIYIKHKEHHLLHCCLNSWAINHVERQLCVWTHCTLISRKHNTDIQWHALLQMKQNQPAWVLHWTNHIKVDFHILWSGKLLIIAHSSFSISYTSMHLQSLSHSRLCIWINLWRPPLMWFIPVSSTFFPTKQPF